VVVGLIASNQFNIGQLLLTSLIPGFWTIYVLSYTGRGRDLTRRRVVMVDGLVVALTGVGLFLLISLLQSTAVRAVASVIGK